MSPPWPRANFQLARHSATRGGEKNQPQQSPENSHGEARLQKDTLEATGKRVHRGVNAGFFFLSSFWLSPKRGHLFPPAQGVGKTCCRTRSSPVTPRQTSCRCSVTLNFQNAIYSNPFFRLVPFSGSSRAHKRFCCRVKRLSTKSRRLLMAKRAPVLAC